jgi:hypothetical protein
LPKGFKVDSDKNGSRGIEYDRIFPGEWLQCAVKIRLATSLLMNRDFDYRVEAEEAMRKAAAATSAIERIKWLRLALAWQDLASGGKDQDAPQKCRL